MKKIKKILKKIFIRKKNQKTKNQDNKLINLYDSTSISEIEHKVEQLRKNGWI